MYIAASHLIGQTGNGFVVVVRIISFCFVYIPAQKDKTVSIYHNKMKKEVATKCSWQLFHGSTACLTNADEKTSLTEIREKYRHFISMKQTLRSLELSRLKRKGSVCKGTRDFP